MFTVGRVLFVFVHFVLVLTIYTTNTVIVPRFFTTNAFFYEILQATIYILLMTSYYRASFSLAGPNSKMKAPEILMCDQLKKQCSKCRAWKPPRAHHCKTCQKCIFRMDHHCEWVNNCVGSHNQKYFMLFLFYTFLISIVTLYLIIIGAIYWGQQQKRGVILALSNVNMTKVQVGSIFLFSIFFAIFTGDFLYEQLQVISDNQTTVESHKEVFGRPNNFFYNLRSVFGSSRFFWLLPTKPRLNMNYLELMYDPEYVISAKMYLEDSFDDKSSQFYDFFKDYKVE